MNDITLRSAEEAFRLWRAHRTSRAESIPESLWSIVLRLYPEYTRSKICQRLRLSGSQFKRRLEGAYTTVGDNGFVLASKDEVKTNPKPTLEVQLTIQGKERALTLCVGVHTLSQVLPHISALL